MTTLEKDPRLLETEATLSGYAHLLKRRLTEGDLGSLPVVLALLIVWVVFQSLNGKFLSAGNLSNLALQIAAVGTISIGIVLVLLLGEIDLSVGSVAGLTSAVMATQYMRHGRSPWVAMLIAVVMGALIGLFQGVMFTKVGVPSFVATLAGFIGWQGLQSKVLGKQGSTNISPGPITKITDTFFVAAYGWAFAAIVIGGYAAIQVWTATQRRRNGLPPQSTLTIALRTLVVAVPTVVAVAVLNHDRGVPEAVLIFVGLVVVFAVITTKTTYGRHVFAVGGNIEAARRAGIKVDTIRISVFVLSSTLAAVGGILLASRLNAVTTNSGQGDLMMNAIAAAVIGGTSLFGGRGTVWAALLGSLVIGSISNGLDLKQQPASVKLMITAAVLLAAVALDSIARRTRKSSGRA
ncbi:MAG: sugar ABC transporter permease [Mycobacteriales bacterium]